MILTVTPNPSLDSTIELPGVLLPGQVHRATGSHTDPGGKGVNISRALAEAGAETLALLPGDQGDALLAALESISLPHEAVPIGSPIRTNITLTDPRGITTKINEPGPVFTAETTAALTALALKHAGSAHWIALAGSLPPGAPDDFYAQVVHQLRSSVSQRTPLIAIDASGPALAQAVLAQPDLIKPNAEELLELHRHIHGESQTTGFTAEMLEGDIQLATDLVRSLQSAGVRSALVTLGASGALFVPQASGEDQLVIFAHGPPLSARSTVGAGDAALAGFLIAHEKGQPAAACLRQAAAQGRAAATLKGSTMPGPLDLSLVDVVVEEFHTTMKGSAS